MGSTFPMRCATHRAVFPDVMIRGLVMVGEETGAFRRKALSNRGPSTSRRFRTWADTVKRAMSIRIFSQYWDPRRLPWVFWLA